MPEWTDKRKDGKVPAQDLRRMLTEQEGSLKLMIEESQESEIGKMLVAEMNRVRTILSKMKGLKASAKSKVVTRSQPPSVSGTDNVSNTQSVPES